MKHSPEVMDLIERGILFPASTLLNSENTNSEPDKAEVKHEAKQLD